MNHQFRSSRIVPAAVIATLVLYACGGSTTPVLNPSASSAPASSDVHRRHHGAQIWTVIAGGQVRDQAFEAFDFYNENITIDAGDSVTWTAAGGHEPHTVTFLGPNAMPPPKNDPTDAQPFGGSSYDGTLYTSSGNIAEGQTYTLNFPKPGKYPYLCIYHFPVMTGVIVVQPEGSPYPHPQGFYTGQALRALEDDLSTAKMSVKAFPYADAGTTLAAGIADGLSTSPPADATVMRFLNGSRYDGKSTVTIPVGTTLTWVNQSNNALHTVTFPALGQQPPANPFTPPAGGATYDGSALANSGPMPPGSSYSLTFTKAGTYPYACIFHAADDMTGTIVVQ